MTTSLLLGWSHAMASVALEAAGSLKHRAEAVSHSQAHQCAVSSHPEPGTSWAAETYSVTGKKARSLTVLQDHTPACWTGLSAKIGVFSFGSNGHSLFQ